MIRVDALYKIHRKVTLLSDISFDVAPGEILGLGGENGSGKTVLLQILAGLSRPTSGQVRVAEFDVIKKRKEVKRRVGYVGIDPTGYEDVRVDEYLRFWAATHRLPKGMRARVVHEAIELAGLSDVVQYPLGRLSRGTRRRVELARILLHDPQVLLLDDPLAGLDAPTASEWFDSILQLAELGKTVVVASSQLGEWLPFCQSVGFLREGRLVAWGMLSELGQSAGMPYFSRLRLAPPDETEPPTLDDLPGVIQIDPFRDGYLVSHTTPPEELLMEMVKRNLPVAEFSLDWRAMERWLLSRWGDPHARAGRTPG